MRVTVIGHAGLFVETEHGSVLCDPWFVPAFHGSWFVFPRNDGLDKERLRRPDYLYVSHLHYDHFDAPFLSEWVDKDTPVLLPEFPTPDLEKALRELGFGNVVHCPNGEQLDLDGLQVAIFAETAPSDGPIGDSAVVIADETARILNMNDCRPSDVAAIRSLGPIDLVFLQFSGAMWWPVVYEMPPEERSAAARAKREAQLARAVGYARAVGARHVVPSAGPPCFLDPELWDFNDFDRAPDSIFPDATVFLERLDAEGIEGGVLAIPGTTLDVCHEPPSLTVTHPMPDDEVRAIFTDKRRYLERYQADWLPWLEVMKQGWPAPQPDLAGRLAAWWEPLMTRAPKTCATIGRAVLIRAGDQEVLVDFVNQRIGPWDGGTEYQYRLDLPAPLLEWCIRNRVVDLSNNLFLSLRFRAWRPGAYCEELFSFLKALSPERIDVLERSVAASHGEIDEMIRLGDWLVQRWCPHRQADLSQFGEIGEDGCTLTCQLHGWTFDLSTGTCANATNRRIAARRVD
ncbi:Rieske 2Fe-2S domain-containing protein [Rhabdothermincola sp.]|uniref:Rieske 2Fe-2S domain-containing protein n=1 Tax=Rhabdothermincola sp. TaxID=2820405 RepID=UPI002FE193D1